MSVALGSKESLEARGDYVVVANAASGFFAVFPNTWVERLKRAKEEGRVGPNLVVCRTVSDDARDHYVIPYSVVRDFTVPETLATSKNDGSKRWNFTLRNHMLHVTHKDGHADVSMYHGATLIVESVGMEASSTLLAEEVANGSTFSEGDVERIMVNRYEREPRARAQCIEHYGAVCFVCGFDFGAAYGHELSGFIHVHHLRPLSSVGRDYSVDPVVDLRPVCPNCHAVIHRKDPPYAMEDVLAMLQRWNADD